jgi:hypothetical protein
MCPLRAPLLVSQRQNTSLGPPRAYLRQEWRLRETHAEMPTKQSLLEVCEILFSRGVREQDSDRSHYDRHQEYKTN